MDVEHGRETGLVELDHGTLEQVRGGTLDLVVETEIAPLRVDLVAAEIAITTRAFARCVMRSLNVRATVAGTSRGMTPSDASSGITS